MQGGSDTRPASLGGARVGLHNKLTDKAFVVDPVKLNQTLVRMENTRRRVDGLNHGLEADVRFASSASTQRGQGKSGEMARSMLSQALFERSSRNFGSTMDGSSGPPQIEDVMAERIASRSRAQTLK